MFLRISSGLLALLLAGCGAASLEPGGITMDCAIAGAADLAPDCSVYEVKAVDEVAFLVMWHPDGGFRRVRYRAADNTVEVLDGAELATGVTRLDDGRVEFVIAADRYRLPAQFVDHTLRAQPTPQ